MLFLGTLGIVVRLHEVNAEPAAMAFTALALVAAVTATFRTVLAEARAALTVAVGRTAAITARTTDVMQASMKLGEAMYKASQSEGAAAAPGGGPEAGPDAGGGTWLLTETRVWCTDRAALLRFTPYWYLIRPVSGLIRHRLLARVRDAALAAG